MPDVHNALFPLPVQDVQTARDEQGDEGFTLLEILVVLAILALLVGLVAPAALRQLGGARNSVAHQSIARIGTILDMYKLDTGTYPSSDEGLEALVSKPSSDASGWNGPYVKDGKVPLDPWNHAYIYRNPSSRDGHDYDLCSGGSQNRRGGPGQDGMICN